MAGRTLTASHPLASALPFVRSAAGTAMTDLATTPRQTPLCWHYGYRARLGRRAEACGHSLPSTAPPCSGCIPTPVMSLGAAWASQALRKTRVVAHLSAAVRRRFGPPTIPRQFRWQAAHLPIRCGALFAWPRFTRPPGRLRRHSACVPRGSGLLASALTRHRPAKPLSQRYCRWRCGLTGGMNRDQPAEIAVSHRIIREYPASSIGINAV